MNTLWTKRVNRSFVREIEIAVYYVSFFSDNREKCPNFFAIKFILEFVHVNKLYYVYKRHNICFYYYVLR